MCLFCDIVEGTIPSQIVYEDDSVIAINDIAPQAPVHVLILPKKHIEDAHSLTRDQDELLFHIFEVSRKIADTTSVSQTGYRIITNVGADAGQSVQHLHFHLIGGKPMNWNN